MGTKGDELSIGRVWAAGFHHVRARSRLARVLKLMNRLFFLIFQFFSGCGKPLLLNSRMRGSASTVFSSSKYSLPYIKD
jgi:hypothetical protein